MSLRIFDSSAPRLFRSTTIDDLNRLDAVGLVWVDATGAEPDQIDALGSHFGFHPLSIEDARKRRQRPKVDVYPDHLFAVLYALDPPSTHDEPTMSELSVFVAPNAVVTVHPLDIDELDLAAHRWAEHCAGSGHPEVMMLVYTIADSVVDGYFPVMDAIGERIAELETLMFANGSEDALQGVFGLKRMLLEIRRVVAPTRDVFNAFTRRELPLLGEHSAVYFQDVYDHVIRVTDTIDAYRDILSSVIDVYLSLVSNRLNQTVRTLTSASIILMSLALVAGIYGMNFTLTPSPDWEFSFPVVIVGMAVLGSALVWVFWRRGWI